MGIFPKNIGNHQLGENKKVAKTSKTTYQGFPVPRPLAGKTAWNAVPFLEHMSNKRVHQNLAMYQ